MASYQIFDSKSAHFFLKKGETGFSQKCRKRCSQTSALFAVQTQQRPPSTTGTVKRAMTATEKILSRASERGKLVPGENIWAKVDALMTHDVCGWASFDVFKREFGDDAKDETTINHEPVCSDEDASFVCEYKFDVSKLEPVVAKPHSPDNRALERECKDVKIDRVYIGSCTGGKTEDFLAAAKGKKVKVPTFLVPATQKVWVDIYGIPVPGSGGKTCSQIFEEAGCDVPASPTCGACMGGPRDTYARLNEPQVCVSTTNRNFPGRMGHKEGQIYLASPYTAAASALTGFVTDPREFLQ